MPLNVSLSQMTVVDLCDAIDRGDITVNKDYQRSNRVWPPAARSFLIETILLGYPMPKLYMSQVTDLKTRKTRKEIVDGQQRTTAIHEFYKNGFKLSRKAVPEEAAGKTFDELDETLQQQFIGYGMSADLFIGATSENIREMFRRMNSYTVPLNAEEKRHSEFQGDFKWFIYRLSKQYAQALENAGVLTEKQLARMAGAKLFTEISHALLKGIKTTSAAVLRALYAENDADFGEEETVGKRITAGVDVLLELNDIHGGPLMRPYHAYALLLALIHSRTPVGTLKEAYTFEGKRAPNQTVVSNLGRLADALEDPDNAPKKYKAFLDASDKSTNTAANRTTRFVWFCRALENKL
nr:protein of unknown function DUF262 [uncultured bacterium]